ncbi:LysR family transcriptional regulator [Finegoldia magna]|uniref:LysR family transcriptional regulator n=1 Tax=Finegoldia magna TaxID=1260 RepID=UPI0026ED0E27|nr:LysR family transcriptional regulator [Finegoldia magna]MDU5187004.1 LysR family transcriptional regulator [Finegoldia magna]MDU5923949.1 LysR family transcriptional regulator [Finegoldia magna]
MDISKLESFLVLADCKSFTKTAELRYLSQPAISKHIDSLEQELGVFLFDRNGKTVSLTIQGRHFIKYAESIVKIYQKSQELIRQIEDLNQGTLYFGSTNFIGIYLMPKFIKAFQDKYPKINVNMTVGSSKDLFKKLEKNEIEFVFLSHYVKIDTNKYISKPFFTDEMVLVVSSKNKLAEKSTCSISDIKDQVFITKSQTSSLYKFLESCVVDVKFKKELIIDNQEAIKKAVVENAGVSIMSKKSAQLEEEAGLVKCIKIEDCDFKRQINLVYDKNLHITPAGQAFFDVLDTFNNLELGK